jgi:hypothetical protein
MSQVGKYKRSGGFLAPVVFWAGILGFALILWKFLA